MVRFSLIVILIAGIFAATVKERAGPDRGRESPTAPQIEAKSEAEPAASSPSLDGILIERSNDGHFYANVEVNGQPIRFLVDTGASIIALSRDDARRAGLAVSVGMPQVVGQGASGEVRGEYVTLDRVGLGARSAEGVRAVVLDGGNQSLLGQEFLSRFDIQVSGDRMVLR